MLVGVFPSSSCAPNPTISTDGLDRSCVADDDCVPAYSGDVCKREPCLEDEAINRDAAIAYEEEFQSKAKACGQPISVPFQDGDCPPLFFAACTAGQCSAVPFDSGAPE